MSDTCTGSCDSCPSSCGQSRPSREEMLEPANPYSHIKKVIGVVSGKGGVGKSFVTSFLSVLMSRKGYKTAILDADVTGPSIPKAFGLHKKATGNELGIFPCSSANGTRIMSVNLILDSEETPVIWRGPIVAGTVRQFWSEVVWGDVDYMFVDMPPGTSDVPLTVFQSIPLDGIIVVTSPQELVTMIVSKAVHMAEEMQIPILGIVENYSYVSCGKCGEKIQIFGESHVEEAAAGFGLPVLGRVPLSPEIAAAVDSEQIEALEGDWLSEAVACLEESCPVRTGEAGIKEKSRERHVRVAVGTDENNNIFGHFGKTKRFLVYEMDGNILLQKTELFSNGEGHSELVGLLSENKVDVLICGGIGASALDMLLAAGIMVIPGQSGDVEVAAAAYADGSLMGEGAPTCPGHEPGESCGGCAGGCH